MRHKRRILDYGTTWTMITRTMRVSSYQKTTMMNSSRSLEHLDNGLFVAGTLHGADDMEDIDPILPEAAIDWECAVSPTNAGTLSSDRGQL